MGNFTPINIRRAVLSLTAGMVLLLTGCGKFGPPPGPGMVLERKLLVENLSGYKPVIGRSGGRVVQATIGDPKSFNPILAKETSTTTITGLMFLGLTRINGVTLEPEPDLAERWEITDDGKTYIFHLREGLQWSDGEPISADDVVFTFQLIYDPNIPNSSADVLSVEGKPFEVDAVGPRAVRVRLPARFAPFLEAMGQSIMPKHSLEEVWRKGSFNSSLGVETPPDKVVCSGPFMLEAYRPGERVLLKRNPRYWRRDAAGNRLPYLEGVTILIMGQAIMPLKFKAGEIDVMSVRGSDYPDLKPLEKKLHFTLIDSGPGTGSNFVVFNQNPNKSDRDEPFVKPVKLKWFTNPEFRRAVAHAIDKKSITDIVLNGFGYPQTGPMTVSEGYFYNPNVRQYPYDLARARQILAQAGFKDGNGDGYIEDPEGNTVEFTLLTNTSNEDRAKIGTIVRKDLERIGIKVHFTLVEFNTLVSKLSAPPYDWEAILLGLTGGPEPHDGQNVWKSSGQLHEWNPVQKKPATAWEAEIDRLFNEGVQELDRAKRKQIYDRWQEIVCDELPVIYTVTGAALVAVRNKFSNLYPTPLGGVFHNIDEIFVKESSE